MTEARPLESRDLITLYARRLQDRQGEFDSFLRPSHRTPVVHYFGRQPVVRSHRSPRTRAVAVSALVMSALLGGTQGAAAVTHQVQPGETLNGIAARYQTTTSRLVELNDIRNPDVIKAGSTLTIEPGDTTPLPGRSYRVRPGDTLSAIASRYGTTADAIARANGLADVNHLATGTELLIPGAIQATTISGAGGPSLHQIAHGEALSGIAAEYQVSLAALVSANGIDDPDNLIPGELLQVPTGGPVAEVDDAATLPGMPVFQQSLPLSCEAAAVSIATAYWGNQISEWTLIENLPSSPNPHYGFRGSMTGTFGSTEDYGVYAEPFVPLLNQYGFAGHVFYADGDADLLKQEIQQGHPVVVWITNQASIQERGYEWLDGERFALVPQEHSVVVHGYDDQQVYIADPGDGAYRTIGWDDFMRSWGYFDGMSLAVYPL